MKEGWGKVERKSLGMMEGGLGGFVYPNNEMCIFSLFLFDINISFFFFFFLTKKTQGKEVIELYKLFILSF